MQSVNILNKSEVKKTARLVQLQGIYDLDSSNIATYKINLDIELPEVWNIGVIVGASGTGKTTIANHLFLESIINDFDWSSDKSVVDDFPQSMSIKDISIILNSVGFSSPPSWVKPYHVLSNGEKFRVTLARAIAESNDLFVMDEFTSVVDRTVAQIGSYAVQKTIRKLNKQFVAVSCHYDIIDWLEPDWVLDVSTRKMEIGRSRRRPEIKLDIKRVHYSAWELFRYYHYLDKNLNKAAYCFCAFWDNRPVAFCAVLHFPHPKSPGWRYHRLVVLPDFQGVGIGSILADYVGSIFASTEKPVRRTLAHPAVIHAANKSKNWKMIQKPKMRGKSFGMLKGTTATTRLVASFQYVGEPQPIDKFNEMKND